MRRSKEQWQALIAEQQSSGLSAAAYCRHAILCESAPAEQLFDHFGFNLDNVVSKANELF